MAETYLGNVMASETNPNICRIAVGSSLLAKGIMTVPLTVGASANWDGGSDVAGQQLVSDLLNTGTTALNNVFGSSFKDSSVRSVLQTRKTWTGSAHPGFSLSFIVPALLTADNVITKTKKIYQAVLPQEINTATMVGPLGYTTDGTTAKGTLTVKIGNWFMATGMLANSVSIDFSQETLTNGNPLYATVNITVGSWKMITGADVEGWFVSA